MVAEAIIALILGLFSIADSVSAGGCQFPVGWHGEYFHLGYSQPLLLINSTISGKGKCLENMGSQYIMEDKEYGDKCWRCMTIFRKHHNVLQYRESYCEASFESFEDLCSGISGDSPMYSMFRKQAEAEACPFRGAYTLSYTRGGAGTECSFPRSYMDSCQDTTRLHLNFQACTDIPGSESSSEEVRCLAGWKEGSKHYLVGEVVRQHAISHEQLIRCFIYEKHGKGHRGVIRMAESVSATCSGLWSPLEGARVFQLKQVEAASPACRLPAWLQPQATWTAPDSAVSLRMSSHQTFSLENILDSVHPESSQVACHTNLKADKDTVMLVSYVKSDCDSGFVCLEFRIKGPRQMQLLFGQKASVPAEACTDLYFNEEAIKSLTLVNTTPERLGSCGLSGNYQLIPLSPGINELSGCPVENSPLHLVAECGASSLSLEWGCPGGGKLTRRRYSCTSSWFTEGRTHQILRREDDNTQLCLVYADSVMSIGGHNCTGGQSLYRMEQTRPCPDALASPLYTSPAGAATPYVCLLLWTTILLATMY